MSGVPDAGAGGRLASRVLAARRAGSAPWGRAGRCAARAGRKRRAAITGPARRMVRDRSRRTAAAAATTAAPAALRTTRAARTDSPRSRRRRARACRRRVCLRIWRPCCGFRGAWRPRPCGCRCHPYISVRRYTEVVGGQGTGRRKDSSPAITAAAVARPSSWRPVRADRRQPAHPMTARNHRLQPARLRADRAWPGRR
jgi:hypothetical protein